MAESPSSGPAHVLLVHGAFHGAWCWAPVIPLLEQAGVRVTAIDLPGHGADPGPLSDLHGDAERVEATLARLGAPVVLVGHSYGGAVITEAGGHPAVSHLVYLAALALDEGETCQRAGDPARAAGTAADGDGPSLAQGLIPTGDGVVVLDPAVAAACLYQDCDPDTVAWALEQLGPQPLASLRQSPTVVAWRRRPSTYVICAQDRAVPPALQRQLAPRCTTALEWPAGHSPFFSRPDLVADLLVERATAARTVAAS